MIKECPKCKSEVKVRYDPVGSTPLWYVECPVCHRGGDSRPTKSEAIECWEGENGNG